MIVFYMLATGINVVGILVLIRRYLAKEAGSSWCKILQLLCLLYGTIFFLLLFFIGPGNLFTLVFALLSIKSWLLILINNQPKELRPQQISDKLEQEVVRQIDMRHQARS